MEELTIVMYHYVRQIVGSKFPRIKGLELEDFKVQLEYLNERFNIVNTEQVIKAVLDFAKLPKDPCWLTFDDGYKDHFEFVLPELLKRNLHGAFFPPRAAIDSNIVLDVNALHHILSSHNDIKSLVSKLNELCVVNGISRTELMSNYSEYGIADRFDDAYTIYFKRMLQHILPEDMRNTITEQLFEESIGRTQADFSNELYMNIDEVRKLVNNGMYVGSHGSMHYWLDQISADQQKQDIVKSLEFLEFVGASTKHWVMCYPYGAHNSDTLSILKKLGASIGLTVEPRRANLSTDNPLKLPRLDTKDFPH